MKIIWHLTVHTKVPTQQSVKAYVDANSSDTTYTAGTGLSLSGTTFNVDQISTYYCADSSK